jgi:phosphoribosylamine--glycine ligase
MKILIIGNGGREHAIARSIYLSSIPNKIYAIPGNPGIMQYAECLNINSDNHKDICNFSIRNNINLVIIGPEVPICNGLSDELEKGNIKVFAPSKFASQLESSKSFTKEIAYKNNIPTAAYKWFNKQDRALQYLDSLNTPIVIKADGLAAGKGVFICESKKEASESINEIFSGKFTDNPSLIIEEFLNGEEVSFFALVDGKDIQPLISAQDHKRLLEGDKGPNTGGMGAYTPTPILTNNIIGQVMNKIIEPTVSAMYKNNTPYKGVLFAGLMITEKGPELIEYNIRFGDPETQAMLMLLKSDLLSMMLDTVNGDLKNTKITWKNETSLTVVLANKGYPLNYKKDSIITGIEDAEKDPGIKVFHAGTRLENKRLIASGGRVLNVTATGLSIEEARKKAYNAIEKIKFKTKYYRKDIAWRAMN